MKKMIAVLLAAEMIVACALAEFKVEVGWYEGREVYKALHLTGLSLRLNEQTRYYETENGLVWQTEAIPFGTLSEYHLPYSERQVRNMNALYAALEDASGFWDLPVKGKGKLAVYSAPDEASLRGAERKAAVEQSGGARLMMTLDDWSLIEYDVSRGARRIGWVRTGSLGSAPVMLTEILVTLYERTAVTDDPHGLQRNLISGKMLSDVCLLARLDAVWGYVRGRAADGQDVWGFVPLVDIRLEETVDDMVMADVAGEWRFAGGGNLLPDVIGLHADGAAAVGECAAQWSVVGGTAGYAHDLLLTSADGRVMRFHLQMEDRDVLNLSQGEAAGSWKRN